jgi:hypothetical protein
MVEIKMLCIKSSTQSVKYLAPHYIGPSIHINVLDLKYLEVVWLTWSSNIWIQNGRTKCWIKPTNAIDDIKGTKDANYSDDKLIMKHIIHIITQTMIGPN